MQESRGKFESQFFKLISEDLAEESMSVGGGALGPAAQGGKSFNPDGQIDSGDTIANRDGRLAKMLGSGTQTRSGYLSKKKKRGIDGVFLTGEEGEEEGHSEHEEQSNG